MGEKKKKAREDSVCVLKVFTSGLFSVNQQ